MIFQLFIFLPSYPLDISSFLLKHCYFKVEAVLALIMKILSIPHFEQLSIFHKNILLNVKYI